MNEEPAAALIGAEAKEASALREKIAICLGVFHRFVANATTVKNFP
jgi:hypothetical protein